MGFVGEPAAFDPYARDASYLSFWLARPLYPSLFKLLPDGSTEPYLADSLSPTPDGVLVSLRQTRWSDGTAITASDVVSSIERARPPSGLAAIDQARGRGDGRVELKGDVKDWPATLATGAPIMPAGRWNPAVQAGPYVVGRVRDGLGLDLRRNEGWVSDPVGPSAVRIRFVEDLGTAMTLLRTGRLDAAALPSSVNLSQRLESAGVAHDRALGWESISIEGRPDIAQELLGSFRSLDMSLLAASFIRGEGVATSSFMPGPGDETYEAGSGAPRPFGSLILGTPQGDELLALLGRAIQVQLADLGSLDLVNSDSRTFYGPWRRDPPVDLRLLRSVGGPGAVAFRGLKGRSIPLFRVDSFLAHSPDIEGPRAAPNLDGPLWNLESWRRAAEI
jgi:hypothetical protein